jgi:hypothetical protein
MKTFVIIGFTIVSFSLNSGCGKSVHQTGTGPTGQADCFKGTLVKKGICGQLVVKINSQAKEGVTYASSWKDESTGKTYENVFTVENMCSFPSSINEGGEFNFKITKDAVNNCMVCQVFTPVPKEKNSIIVNGDCAGVRN